MAMTTDLSDLVEQLEPFVTQVVGSGKFKVQGFTSKRPNYPLCTFFFLNPHTRIDFGNTENVFQSTITLTIWSTDYIQSLNLTERLKQVLSDQFNRMKVNQSDVSIVDISDITNRPQTVLDNAQSEYGAGLDITFLVQQPYDDAGDSMLEINTQKPIVE